MDCVRVQDIQEGLWETDFVGVNVHTGGKDVEPLVVLNMLMSRQG